MLNLCFQINSTINSDFSENLDSCFSECCGQEFEKHYQSYYKKIIQFLYSKPFFLFTFSFSGCQLEWLGRHHKEFIVLLSKMCGRKQIELLGGGFYIPLLPTLLSVDRLGQIELLTTTLRKYTGKRPRGMRLPNNAWDSSLISGIKGCGMEYIVADSHIIPSNSSQFLPYIVQDQGKNLYILAQRKDLSPQEDESPQKYIDRLIRKVSKSCPDADKPVVCCEITAKKLCEYINSGWLDELQQIILSEKYYNVIELNLPAKYIKSSHHFQRSYLPACVYLPSQKTTISSYDYLLRSPDVFMLYSKMMYISQMVNQSRGDKTRKNAAKHLLWQAQKGAAYCTTGRDLTIQRESAYHCLIQAERTVREYTNFYSSVTSFDYDSDGVHEYICQFDHFNAYIQARGGSVFEFDIIKNAYNYAANATGHTGLFLDYITDNADSVFDDTLTRQIYKEVSFDAKRREIKLLAKVSSVDSGHLLILRKNYYISSNGIQVQYIIRNESSVPIKKYFTVESNFLLSASESETFKTEIVSGEQKELQVLEGFLTSTKNNDVSCIRFSDGEISFVYEVNENVDLYINVFEDKMVLRLSWAIDIPAEREIEKTINISVVPKTIRKKNKK